MKDPYSVLGVKPGADIESIRAAYHARAKMCHPDLVQDADKKQEAQEQLVELNLAYEAALRIAVPYQRSDSIYSGLMSLSQAKQLAKNQLKQGNARTALRNLLRAEQKDAEWHHLHGSILLMLGDYDAAHLACLTLEYIAQFLLDEACYFVLSGCLHNSRLFFFCKHGVPSGQTHGLFL